MVRLLSILLILQCAFGQNRFLLHITPQGRQEAMPMRSGESVHDAIRRFTLQTSDPSGITSIRDSLRYFTLNKELSYEFGNLEEELMMTWFQPYADGFVREVLWAIGSDIGETKQVNVRAWYPNLRLLTIPGTQRQKNMGYYPKSDDPVNLVTPFRELATDSTWVFPLKSRDSVVYAFDPLGVEATWKKGGVNADVEAYSWHSVNLLATGDTMKFQEDQLIGFSIQNTATGTSGVRQEVLSLPNPDHPFHSYKFYPRGRLSSVDRGWWLRGDFEWGMYMIVEYTGVPRPKVTAKKLLNTASTQQRTITATVKTQFETDPVTVTLHTRKNNAPYAASAMTRMNGFTFSGTIPAASPGDSVFYYITATDSTNRTTTTPTFGYEIFKKQKPLLLLYNGKSLPSGIIDPTIYLKFTMKTDFGKEPYYDFCNVGTYTREDLPLMMEQYLAILEVTGDGGAADITHYSGDWLENSSTLPAGQQRTYLFSDQDHGFISNYQDTIFSDTDPHVKYFGVKGIVNQDFPRVLNVMKEVTYPWQLSVTPSIDNDPLFGFIPSVLKNDSVTLWYHPYYEVPLYTNRMDELQASANGTVIFSDTKYGKPVGIRTVDPGNRWQSYFLSFDWMALDVRGDTSSVLYEYPFLDPKYKWIVDLQNIGKTMAALGMITSVTADAIVPSEFSLLQNYPNPFNPSTTIRFLLPSESHVELRIFDILGKQVRLLLNERRHAGEHSVTFRSHDLPSGIYFYRLTAGGFSNTRRMLLMK